MALQFARSPVPDTGNGCAILCRAGRGVVVHFRPKETPIPFCCCVCPALADRWHRPGPHHRPGSRRDRAIAMQPVLYLFPALAIAEGWSLATGHWALVEQRRWIFPTVVLLLFGWLAVDTGNAYFGEWANAPEVRVQYEATRVAAMRFLNENGSGAVAVSSPRPDKFHDPSTALMTLRNDDVDLRWFNGAYSLLVPGEQRATWLFSGFAELHPALQPYFAGAPATGEVTTVRDDDFDRPAAARLFGRNRPPPHHHC